MPATLSSALLSVRWNGNGMKYRNCIVRCFPSMRRMLLTVCSCLAPALITRAFQMSTFRLTERWRKRLFMPYATSRQERSLPLCTPMVLIVLEVSVRPSWTNGGFAALARHARIHHQGEREKESELCCLSLIKNSPCMHISARRNHTRRRYRQYRAWQPCRNLKAW